MLNVYLSQIISSSAGTCMSDLSFVEYVSGRKVTKSVNNRSDVGYIEKYLQVIHSWKSNEV
jgi:hypothetical protein